MDKHTILIFDFDSTFVSVETLDFLAQGTQDTTRLHKIQEITRLGMEGKIPFSESLARRLSLLHIRREDIIALIPKLKEKVTISFQRNKPFFEKYKDQIYILSSGFEELIVPIVSEYGIAKDHVIANRFMVDSAGVVVGVDTKNPLSRDGGKVNVASSSHKLVAAPLVGARNSKASSLHKLVVAPLVGARNNKARQRHGAAKIWVIGDGYTDFELKKEGIAEKFFCFSENVSRPAVEKQADVVVHSLEEFLYQNDLPRRYSYPKSGMKALLLEGIHPLAERRLAREGYQVRLIPQALSEKELINEIGDISLIGIRSRTQITPSVLSHAKKLLTIGAFCIGTNQIDIESAGARGIAVFNAPYSNTRSVVELVIGYIVMLMRNLGDKNTKLHKGIWDKSADGASEVRGKTLGIVGYGNIGSQLSVVAEALGMKVFFYDVTEKLVLGNATALYSLDELLRRSDIVSIHVDGRRENTNLISESEIASMKDGAYLINASRGHIVDEAAVARAIQKRKLSGAAFDVYPTEPKSNSERLSSPLQNLPNVVLTPHVGGATCEAQENIGTFVAEKMVQFVNTGDTRLSVSLPNVALPKQTDVHRILHIHDNVPGVLAGMNTIFGRNAVNIEGQYLKTNEKIGYAITDVDKNYKKEMLTSLKKISGTIRVRVLY